MATYTIYDLDVRGHVTGLPHVISCQNDSDAVFAAEQMQRGADRQIWQEDRCVGIVSADTGDHMAAMSADIRETVVMTRQLIENSREQMRLADQSLERR